MCWTLCSPHSMNRGSASPPLSASFPDKRYHRDSICSILTCRFILSLRQFDSTIASVRTAARGSRAREHMTSMLEFGAQPSTSLPSFIASFAHPVHVDSEALSEVDPEIVVDGSECLEMDVVASASLETPSERTPPAPGDAPALKDSA